jgi:hypothetical protein
MSENPEPAPPQDRPQAARRLSAGLWGTVALVTTSITIVGLNPKLPPFSGD